MSVFVIIGGSSGIGKQLTLQLLEAGHEVCASYRNHSFEEQEDFTNSDLHSFRWDVLHEDTPALPDSLPDRVDGLVYCPGSVTLKPFKRISSDEFVDDYRLQVAGAATAIQALLPRLQKADNASIVLFSTTAVQTGLNFHSLASASKGAIEGLTRALAAELAPNIRVNAIAPSLTETPLASGLLNNEKKREANAARHPLKRIGRPADIANMAELLLSEKGSWITGQILHVDGGMSAIRQT
jgi:NAD(P)-dependent dehydrogenase (short-subunit alcohol dehydrogenase family)